MPCKIDLHTHSIASPDSSITAKQFKKALSGGVLSCIAVTDHNRIDFAQKLQKELGPEAIIIGEEISTKQGDIIGLYLTSLVEPNQEISQAIEAIKKQGGLVYIPHPFETVRKGISHETLDNVIDDIDIIESANGRAFFQNLGTEAHTVARIRYKHPCASSDAHRSSALGKTYTEIKEIPKKDNLLELLSLGKLKYTRPSFLDIMAPKMSKFSKLFRGK